MINHLPRICCGKLSNYHLQRVQNLCSRHDLERCPTSRGDPDLPSLQKGSKGSWRSFFFACSVGPQLLSNMSDVCLFVWAKQWLDWRQEVWRQGNTPSQTKAKVFCWNYSFSVSEFCTNQQAVKKQNNKQLLPRKIILKVFSVGGWMCFLLHCY